MNEVTQNRPGGGDDRLLSWPAVQAVTGLSRTTAWRMQKVGTFPEPVVVSPGRVGWWESELSAWKLARAPRRAREPRPFAKPRKAAPDADRSESPAPVCEDKQVDDRPLAEVQVAEDSSTTSTKRRTRKIAPGQIAFDFGP